MRLIRHAANVCAKTSQDLTALHYAADRGKAQMIPRLVANGAELEAKNFEGHSPLHSAILSTGPSETIKHLSRARADRDAMTGTKAGILPRTPFHLATEKRKKQVLRSLIFGSLAQI